MENNEKRDWALDNEKPTKLDEAVNFLNGRPHLYKNGQIDRYAVGRIMIEWASQNASTSDEALHIADVGGCTDLDIEDAASDCAEYYEKQTGENLTAREKSCFIDGYNVGGKSVRNRLTKKY